MDLLWNSFLSFINSSHLRNRKAENSEAKKEESSRRLTEDGKPDQGKGL